MQEDAKTQSGLSEAFINKTNWTWNSSNYTIINEKDKHIDNIKIQKRK